MLERNEKISDIIGIYDNRFARNDEASVDSKGIFIRQLIHENEPGMLGQKRSPIIPKTTECHPPHCESSAACLGVKGEFPTDEPVRAVGCC